MKISYAFMQRALAAGLLVGFGSILAVSWNGLATIAIISVAVAAALAVVGRRLIFPTFDADGAQVTGI